MMAALYSGVSGLSNHQTKMDVIANNISNVNTAGFKASRVVFQDVMSQTVTSASAPTDTLGGTNPSQIGLGVRVATIDTLFTNSASLQRTDDLLDLAISGDGFFYVTNSNGDALYTRVGNFYLDAEGNLTTVEGYFVQGYSADKSYDMTYTSMSKLADMIDETTLNYGDLGDGMFSLQAKYDDASGIMTLIVTDRETGEETEFTYDTANGLQNGDTITFTDADGRVISFDLTDDVDADDLQEALSCYIGKAEYEMNYNDMGKINLGDFPGYEISQDGTIYAIDNFGNYVTVGQLSVAMFTNNSGLEKVGNSYYQRTTNSGDPLYTTATENGSGTINAGYLEMSNVDLATEFTEMIVTQRGFQANSRIITTSDSMLEELVNLKR